MTEWVEIIKTLGIPSALALALIIILWRVSTILVNRHVKYLDEMVSLHKDLVIATRKNAIRTLNVLRTLKKVLNKLELVLSKEKLDEHRE